MSTISKEKRLTPFGRLTAIEYAKYMIKQGTSENYARMSLLSIFYEDSAYDDALAEMKG